MQKITEDERQLVDKIADNISRRRLSVPAILFLEMTKPLSFIGSSLVAFFEPVIQSIVPFQDIESFRKFIEDRENVEYLIQEIEKKGSMKGK